MDRQIDILQGLVAVRVDLVDVFEFNHRLAFLVKMLQSETARLLARMGKGPTIHIAGRIVIAVFGINIAGVRVNLIDQTRSSRDVIFAAIFDGGFESGLDRGLLVGGKARIDRDRIVHGGPK